MPDPLPVLSRLALATLITIGVLHAQDTATVGAPGDGYRGIWYSNQPSGDEYAFKYSGGLGTYCAKHRPFAVYSPEANKTFFCFGATLEDGRRDLVHAVSYFDHETGTVPRPTILLDKRTGDAHDNPVIALDDDGYVWIFSTSHGRSRPSFVHRSVRPYDVTGFEKVDATYVDEEGRDVPLTNFSYMQAWHVPQKGFVCFFTRYDDPAKRTSMFMTSPDGVRWSRWQRVAAIEWGHYQISAVNEHEAACAFNHHPAGKGLNWRANLYYVETPDLGATWRSADGEAVDLPITDTDTPALVYDSVAEGLLVYLKDITFDADGEPVVLFVTSKSYASGPDGGPRTWRTAHFTDGAWRIRPVTTSDNNYDMGSLYVGDDGTWRIVAPTASGPQRYNTGGEMELWTSDDEGASWSRTARLTAGSPRNHTYARRPVNVRPDFFALWADGDARKVSESRLYFCDADGHVFRLPERMTDDRAAPIPVPLGK